MNDTSRDCGPSTERDGIARSQDSHNNLYHNTLGEITVPLEDGHERREGLVQPLDDGGVRDLVP